MRVIDLSLEYHGSRLKLYKIIARCRQKDFTIHRSENHLFFYLKYGIKRLAKIEKPEYLFVAIDGFSRGFFAAILSDKTKHSSKNFLDRVFEECEYTIECYYSDNDKEYRVNTISHAFMMTCEKNNIPQRFTKVKRPQTNGKIERVIRTLMEMWHNKVAFKSPAHRKKELIRFVNYYNLVKPHKSIYSLIIIIISSLNAVSYTHLTLPTN